MRIVRHQFKWNSVEALASLAATLAVAVAVLVGCGGEASNQGDGGRSAPAFRVGGTFTGLAAGSITLAVGLDQLELATQNDGVIRDIPFAFPTGLPSGASYHLRVLRSDDNVSCEVRNGSGTIGAADVTDILVQCFSIPSLRLLAGRLPKPDVDGIATEIAFLAETLAVTADGTIYMGADSGLGTQLPLIRRITPSGFLTTIAGGAVGPAVDGRGAAVGLIRPRGLAIEPDGNLLFGDGTAIRRVTPDGVVSTIAGSLTEAGTIDTSGIGAPDPRAARFSQINGLVRANDGAIYVTDRSGFEEWRVRRLGGDGGIATLLVSTEQLNGLTFGLDGQLYVGLGQGFDGGVGRLRITGAGATLERLADGATPPSRVSFISKVVAVAPETATSLIALGERFGQLARYYTDGRAAEFITGGGSFTLTKCVDGRLSGAQFDTPKGMIAVGPDRLLVADSLCRSLRVVDLSAGRVSTLFGSLGFGTTDGVGQAASFHGLSGLALDSGGQRLISTEALGLLVRAIGIDGGVRTLVGEPTNTQQGHVVTGDTYLDGSASAATFANPSAIAGDGSGGFFLLDRPWSSHFASALRHVDRDGNVMTIRSDVRRAWGPSDFQQYLALDAAGRFLIPSGHAILRFGRTGIFESIAGTGTAGFADSPSAPQFDTPAGIAVARDGTIYVADSGNSAVRRIATDGTVTTLTSRRFGPSVEDFTTPVAVALTEREDFLLVLDSGQFVVKAIDLRPGMGLALRTVVGKVGANALGLGPLPGSLAPPYQVAGQVGFSRSTEWLTHALLVRGSTLYIALGDVILEADLALR
jgi:sugar lactone lactonase YvrE